MRAVAVVIVCGVGCNQVFGIRETQVITNDARACTLHPGDPGFLDEDGDGIEDTCDNCPGTFNALQQDGVGDACDPHPLEPGDLLVSAEFFNGPTYSWTPNSGASWQLDASGSLVTTAPPDATMAMLALHMTIPAPTIEIGFTVTGYAPMSENESEYMFVSLTAPNATLQC